MSGLLPLLLHGRGLVELGHAVQVIVHDDREYLHCVGIDTGNVYRRCPVVGWSRLPLHVPREPYAGDRPITEYPVVVLGHRANNMDPLVLDVARSSRGARTTKDYEPPEEEESNTDPTNVRDLVTENAGTTFKVRPDGSIVVSPASHIEVILNGKEVRLSNAGEMGSGVAKADATSGQLNNVIDALNSLVTALRSVVPDPITGAVTVTALQAALAPVPAVVAVLESELRAFGLRVPGKSQ